MPFFSGQSREELRRAYIDAWQRHRSGAVLTQLDAQIAAVIADHPEYHAWLEGGEDALRADFPPEHGMSNPFLHMGMHLALRDQAATDRPPGIAALQLRLATLLGAAHGAEHRMMEALGKALWEAQRSGRPPDEQAYLADIARLATPSSARKDR
jgi:hypothetical protein